MKKYTHTFSLLLLGTFVVLGLSACAEGDSGMNADSTAMGADTTAMRGQGGMQSGMQSDSVSLQSTTQMLQGGVTSIAVNKAVQNINGWQQKIEGSSNMALQNTDLHDNLDDLKDELQSDNLDGDDIAETLKELGRLTNEAAQEASGQQMSKITGLGQALTQAGNKLGTGASNQDAM